MKRRRFVIKVGSNVLLRSDGQFRGRALTELCSAVAAHHEQGGDAILVTSGAIARGHRRAPRKRLKGKPEMQAASAIGQGEVYHHLSSKFSRRGLRTAQVLITLAEIAKLHHYTNVQAGLETMLRWRAIPVVNENDPATMDDITFENNDYLAEQVATMIDADRLIFLTNVDGVHSGDPRVDPSAPLIHEVPDARELLRGFRISSRAGNLGTGGMYSKVDAAGLATSTGIEALICNGLKADAIAGALAGEQVGTRFPPKPGKHGTFHARRTWLKSQRSRGELLVDAGAASALRRRGGSLLPVGIVAVRGQFAAGAVVDVYVDDDLIGRGITNFSANRVRRMKGRRSAELGERKPGAPEEVIHRDSFVLE